MSKGDVRVFGVRHHGPGCARALSAALSELEPDVVLVEGPPDADGVLPLAASDAMKPPVALLVYSPELPGSAAFYPFTDFSPEWCAIRYAQRADVPVRFMDLPQTIRFRELLDEKERAERAAAEIPDEDEGAEDEESLAAEVEESDDVEDVEDDQELTPEPVDPLDKDHVDPIGLLAQAAGYRDGEEWWDQQVERREDATDLFAAILEAMGAVREARPERESPARRRESMREAWMRRVIRQARNGGYQRIAVVCGAWHAPVLTWDFCKRRGRARDDNELLKGLRKTKVEATWVPWTNSRLAFRSGYGAGVTSPGWYRMLWEAPTQATARWLTMVATLLRGEGIDVSSAHVLEGVRLAEALAALRDLPRPGLSELNDAVVTVLCEGEASPLRLVSEKLVIGDVLGEVPPETPTVPLQQDVDRKQRRLRLKPSADDVVLDLDLRKDYGRGRSRLLHQLGVLGVTWGRPMSAGDGDGSFRERWMLRWQPEFPVSLIEASALGNTTEEAATRKLRDEADATDDLAELTDLLDRSILCGLPDATTHALSRLQSAAAVSSDIGRLMHGMAPLARCARYGDVRGSPTAAVEAMLVGFAERVLAGLVPASGGIDDAAARRLGEGMTIVQQTLGLVEDPDLLDAWGLVLRALSEREASAAHLRGRAARLLLDRGDLSDEALARVASRELSLAHDPPQAAEWLGGFLVGSGLVLLHRDGFWQAFDGWIRALSDEHFDGMLPALRRAFSSYSPSERREMGLKVRRLRAGDDAPGPVVATEVELDPGRAALIVPMLAALLGVQEGTDVRS